MLESSSLQAPPCPMLAANDLLTKNKLKHEKYEVIRPKNTMNPFKLGMLDRNMPFIWFSLLQVFENTRNEPDFMSYQMMRDSLELALEKLPIFSGTPVYGKEPSICSGKGAWLCEEETDVSFLKFKSKIINELLPGSFCFGAKVNAIMKGEDAPVFSAKINRFQCGSVALVVMFHHYAGDGSSLSTFMDLWGSLARNAPTNPSIVDSRLSLVELPETPGFVRKERPPTKIFSTSSDKTLCRLSIPILNLKKLQSDFTSKGYVSTDDIFTAAVWRAKARTCPLMGNTCLVRAVNLRSLVTPPQPPLAVGNFAEGLISDPISLSQMLNMSLQQTAFILRQDIKAFNKDYVESLQAFYHHQSIPEGMLSNFNPSCDFVCSSHARFYTATDFHNSPAIFSSASATLDSTMFISPPYQDNYLGYLYLDAAQADSLLCDPELKEIGMSISKVSPSSLE
ncbi:hypothetical protein DSO57_1013650 [Entomophthora muscae]|uniref:Uncharacterized protein n=1 Tax=Entomophthora muscae TaxID=34485 RepID=A0ACC2T5L0_9FUNG|nr:hypothetical protein DSO57_1013650 [Entomophthora muscae]